MRISDWSSDVCSSDLSPIKLAEGVLFTPYATLRSQARESKASRVDQIVEWLGADFDGVIIFDEAHAMATAAGGKGVRGEPTPSQQGRAGPRLHHAPPAAPHGLVSALPTAPPLRK